MLSDDNNEDDFPITIQQMSALNAKTKIVTKVETDCLPSNKICCCCCCWKCDDYLYYALDTINIIINQK